mgnify:CR=1 FL=1
MIDMSTVAPPDVVQPLDFEALFSELKAEILARLPELADVLQLESEPITKLLQVMAYREVLLRQRVNEAARSIMLAYAVGSDLDQIGANFDTARLPGESDARFRQRIQQAYNRLAAAGPANAYRQHALAVSADIADVDVFSEAAGRVTVTVLARELVKKEEAEPEAATVGALADWFAVVALFRRVPIPFISRHTAIIPRNKDRIGDNLGQFVQEKFLDTQSLVALIRRYEPAQMIGAWFSKPDNAQRVGLHLMQVMSGFLELTDDGRIQRLLKRAVHKAIDKVDFTETSAVMLESMTKNNRHQVLLDAIINRLITLIQRESTRDFIADQIVHWLKTEHPRKAMVLPTEWLGDQSAEMVSNAVNALLDDISHDRTHQIRQAFDRATLKLIDNLKNDPEMAAKADNIKHYLKNDEAFNRYLGEMWADLRQWLKADMQSEDSRVKQRIANAGLWFGETLSNDASLRASLNEHLEQAAHRLAPDFAAFLTRHISDTVKSWDAKDMSRQIELNIGKDLQFIRVNGTLVGGTIGLILFLLSQLPAVLGH